MKNLKISLLAFLVLFSILVSGQQTTPDKDLDKICIQHPWQGKRVAFIGDSFIDPNGYQNITKYWFHLQELLDITPYVYGIGGRQWNDVPRQAEQLHKEHGSEVDAILVMMGTNDFNSGVPIGEWYTEKEEQVMAATGKPQELATRKRRSLVMDSKTYRGRINIAINRLKQLYPNKQIVLLTPMHRAYAAFSERNVQPDESYQNKGGEYVDAYVESVKEAANIWGIPVLDMNATTGINPMVEEQLIYLNNAETDRLHPNSAGHKRIARTLFYQLLSLPCVF